MHAIEACLFKSKGESALMLEQNRSITEDISEVSRRAIEARHNCKNLAEQLEAISQLSESLRRAAHAGKLTIETLIYQKPQAYSASLGGLQLEHMECNLAPIPLIPERQKAESQEQQVLSSSISSSVLVDDMLGLERPIARLELPDESDLLNQNRSSQRSSLSIQSGGKAGKGRRPKKDEEVKGRASEAKPPQVGWSVLTNTNSYKNYNFEDNRLIEEGFQLGLPSVTVRAYTIDLVNMQQIDNKTNKARPIRLIG